VVSGAGVWLTVWGLGSLPTRIFGGHAATHPGAHLNPHWAAQIRWTDLALLLLGSVLWVLLTKTILEKAGSALPRVMMKRLGLA